MSLRSCFLMSVFCFSLIELCHGMVFPKKTFLNAIETGNLEIVQKEIQKHWLTEIIQFTPLMRAIMAQSNHEEEKTAYIDIIKYLIEQGSDLSQKEAGGFATRNIFHFACDTQKPEILTIILDNMKKKNIDIPKFINMQIGFDKTPLHIACEKENICFDMIKRILAVDGINVTIQDEKKRTTLDILIERLKPFNPKQKNECIDIIRLFVEKGATLSLLDAQKIVEALQDDTKKLGIALEKTLKNNDLEKILKNSKKLSKEELFWTAIQNAELETIVKVLGEEKTQEKKNVLLNANDKDGNTPLIIAIQKNNHIMAKSLIENGADVAQCNVKKDYPIHLACSVKNLKILELIVEKLKNIKNIINIKNSEEETPLQIACNKNFFDAINIFLNIDGININVINNKNQTPLDVLFSFYFNNKNAQECFNIIKKLVKKGATISEPNAQKMAQTLPNDAWDLVSNLNLSINGTSKIRNILTAESLKNMNLTPSEKILKAASKGCLETVKEILNTEQTLVNTTDKDGNTPLIMALLSYASTKDAQKDFFISTINYLIKNGANVTKKNNDGSTPLYIACRIRDLDVLNIIVNKIKELDKSSITDHMNVHHTKQDLDSPLHTACKDHAFEVINALLEIDEIDVNAENNMKQTPLHILLQKFKSLEDIQKNACIATIKKLVERGANVNAEDKGKKTPLELAEKIKDNELIKSLKETKPKAKTTSKTKGNQLKQALLLLKAKLLTLAKSLK